MTSTKSLMKQAVALAGAALLATGTLLADVIETKNGSRLTGKVTQIDGSTVVLNTDFAGDVKIKQGEISSIVTDVPMNLRLADGRVVRGIISTTGAATGDIVVTAPEGSSAAALGQISQTWALDAKDPELVKLERHWSYEAGVDVTGKTGTKEQIGSTFSFRATLKSSRDMLQLYTAYNYQVSDHEKSADQFRIGGDYQNNFSGRFSWYVRDEAGFDRVKQIDLSNVAAAGIGYDIIKSKIDTLTLRTGLSHRYEDYTPPGIENLSEIGLDLGLVNHLQMKNWSMTNRITYTPTFDDFGVYRIYHESYIELPMASPRWKFRVGVSNDYNSNPPPLSERLDTTYFARLILTWQ